jgi:hypothetical protein
MDFRFGEGTRTRTIFCPETGAIRFARFEGRFPRFGWSLLFTGGRWGCTGGAEKVEMSFSVFEEKLTRKLAEKMDVR